MKKDKTSDQYEVGYAKPPKGTQFQKGVSGNPSGRPRKTLSFDEKLLKEANSSMIINENGKRKRMSKHEVLLKQLLKQAITGNSQASRIYLSHLRLASENIRLASGSTPVELAKRDLFTLSEEELMMIAAGGDYGRKKKVIS